MSDSWRLIELEGNLYLRYVGTLNSEPKRITYYWWMGRRYETFGPDAIPSEGYPVEDRHNGVFEALVNRLTRAKLRFVLEPKRACEFSEEEEVPPPKSRQPTRWQYGHWEKFTKKHGWQPA